jgi:phosphomannomutase
MREIDTAIGGEGTGGVIYPDLHYTTDGIASIAAIVQFLAESGRTISELVATMPSYVMCKKKLEIPSQEIAETIIQEAEKTYSDQQQALTDGPPSLDLTDGIKRVWNDRWVNIRKSGTEPVLRVFSEARTAEHAESLCDETLETLQHLMKRAIH